MNYNKNKIKNNSVFKVEYDSYKDFVFDYTKNISKGETFILTKKKFEIGDTFKVFISFPKIIKPIPMKIKVMWVYQENFDDEIKQGIGAKFLYSNTSDKEKFQELVKIIAQKYKKEEKNITIKSLFYHSNKFITTSFIDIIKNINQFDEYKHINFVIRTSNSSEEIITDFLSEEKFDIVILDNRINNLEYLISNIKLHSDNLIYVGIGNKKNDIFDFNLKKVFTISKMEALFKILVETITSKAHY